MFIVAHSRTGSTHAVLDNQRVSLCGLLSFHEDNTDLYQFDPSKVNCKRCKAVMLEVRDYVVPPAGEGQIYITTQVVKRLMGRSSVQSDKTHYSLSGEKSICGVDVQYTPVLLIGRGHPNRPTCQKCLASPKVEDIFRSKEAEEALHNRGRYDRKSYGLSQR